MTAFFSMVNANMFANPFNDGSSPLGVSYGLISYIAITVFCGDARKIKGSFCVIAALFVAMLLLTH